MRHKKKGRTLGRSSSHRRAMLKNLASSLFLTERDPDYYTDLYGPDGRKVSPPRAGRVVTTLQKAKEVRPLVEKCITIARRSLKQQQEADSLLPKGERGSDEWKSWRKSEQWQTWNAKVGPTVAARRHALRLLGSKEAVQILFEEVAPRFADRDGGYTRILRLAATRLGDAGRQAVLELVGTHDRVSEKSEKPAFTAEETDETSAELEDEAGGDDASAEDEDSGDAQQQADDDAGDAGDEK